MKKLVASLILVTVPFAYALATAPTLIVLPVSLPVAVVDNGYSPTVVSQAVAARIATMIGIERPRRTEDLELIGRRPALVASSSLVDLPDIQIPDQPFSFRSFSRFVRDAFGNGDPTVSISIAHADAGVVVRATAVGGAYAGRRTSATVPSYIPLERMMLTAAALAVNVVQPLRYAVFLADPDTQCPVGLRCQLEVALNLVGQLLADDHLEDDARAHLVYAFLALAGGRTTDALQHCKAAAGYEATRDWARIQCSYSHLANNERDRAIKTVLGAVPLRSDDPDVHAGFGDLFLELCQYLEAEGAYKSAVRLDSRHVYSMIGLGTIARHRRRFADAVEHYRAALRVNPNEPYALGGLGASLVGLGESEASEAHLYLKRAVSTEPNYTVAKIALATLRSETPFSTLDGRRRRLAIASPGGVERGQPVVCVPAA